MTDAKKAAPRKVSASQRAKHPKQLQVALARSDTKASNEAELYERRAMEFQLRKAGASVPQIAERMGLSPAVIYKDLRWCYDQLLPARDLEDMRELEKARLDDLRLAVWPAAKQGDLKAVETWLKISNRYSRLVGLDAPIRLADVNGGSLFPVDDVPPVVLAQIVQMTLENGAPPDTVPTVAKRVAKKRAPAKEVLAS